MYPGKGGAYKTSSTTKLDSILFPAQNTYMAVLFIYYYSSRHARNGTVVSWG